MGKKLKLLSSLCLVSVLLVSVLAAGCTAKPAAPTPTSTPTSTPALAPVSFEGKTVSIIIPTTVGGGVDIMTRVYAKFLTKYLPGNPTVIVRAMPGGAGTLGVNAFYNSKPDGLTVIVTAGPNAIAYILGTSAVKYDLLKTTAVVATSTSAGCVLWSGIIPKAEDLLMAKALIFGASVGFSLTGWTFVAAKELLNFPVDKVIMAYSGGSESRRAFLTREINMTIETAAGYADHLAPYVQRGEVMLLFQTGVLDKEGKIIKDPVFPPVPTVGELYEKIYGKSPSGMAWEAYKGLVGLFSYHYVLQLPPGVPDNIIRAYWDAAEKMINDPEFKQMTGRLIGEKSPWYAGEAVAREYKRMMGMDRKVVEWLKDLMKTKYGIVVE